MSASCSIELCTAIPLATKLWPPSTVASKTSSTPSGSIDDDLVPEDVVDGVASPARRRRGRRRLAQPLPVGACFHIAEPQYCDPIAAGTARCVICRSASTVSTVSQTCAGTVSTLVLAVTSANDLQEPAQRRRRGPRARRSPGGSGAGLSAAADVQRVAVAVAGLRDVAGPGVEMPKRSSSREMSSTSRRLVDA